MRTAWGMALAVLIGLSGSGMWAQSSTRVRGTIESVHGNTLAVKSYSGKTTDVMLQSGTKYVWVTPASLSDIKPGDFIGAAATGPKDHMKAQEVAIFPNSMRGMGEGHYSWSIPPAVLRADEQGTGGASSMTNGTMSNGTMSNGAMSNGTMTNGTMSNRRKLTISFQNGQKVHVTVPPNAPVVRFVPAQKSALSPGSKVFIMASKSGGELNAKLVAVGKNGLMPPM